MASIDRQSSSTSAIPVFVKRRIHNYQNHRITVCQNNGNNNDGNCNFNYDKDGGAHSSPKLRRDADDSYSAYRRLCEARMRRLERYKKARSFCSLHDENGSDPPADERAADIFGRAGSEAPPLGETARAASSSCSHLTAAAFAGVDNFHRSDTLSTFRYGHSECHNESTLRMPINNARATDLILSKTTVLKPAPDLDSICVDSDYSASHLPHLKHVLTDDKINYNIDKNNNSSWSEQLNLIATSPKTSPLNLQFEILREKMIAIMENDVQLLKKLLTLGETIQEIRGTRGGAAPPPQPVAQLSRGSDNENTSSSSENNTDEEEMVDEWRPLKSGATQSAVTRLFVGGDRPSDDEDPVQPSVQYFSRRNSVLRIPIPPRSSNRMLGKRSVVKPSEARQNSPKAPTTPSSNCGNVCVTQTGGQGEDSGHSSASNSPASQCSPSGATAAPAAEPSITVPATVQPSPPLEMAIFALRSELKASLINGGAKADAADSGRSTLIQCSSSSASSSIGGSSRYSTFSAESFCMEGAENALESQPKRANAKTIFVGVDEKFGALSMNSFELARTIT